MYAISLSKSLDSGPDPSNSSSSSHHVLYECCGCSVTPSSIPQHRRVTIECLGDLRSAGSAMSKPLTARLPKMLERYKGVSPIRRTIYSTQRTVTILYQCNLALRTQGSFGQPCSADFLPSSVCTPDISRYEERTIERRLGEEVFRFWNIAEWYVEGRPFKNLEEEGRDHIGCQTYCICVKWRNGPIGKAPKHVPGLRLIFVSQLTASTYSNATKNEEQYWALWCTCVEKLGKESGSSSARIHKTHCLWRNNI